MWLTATRNDAHGGQEVCRNSLSFIWIHHSFLLPQRVPARVRESSDIWRVSWHKKHSYCSKGVKHFLYMLQKKKKKKKTERPRRELLKVCFLFCFFKFTAWCFALIGHLPSRRLCRDRLDFVPRQSQWRIPAPAAGGPPQRECTGSWRSQRREPARRGWRSCPSAAPTDPHCSSLRLIKELPHHQPALLGRHTINPTLCLPLACPQANPPSAFCTSSVWLGFVSPSRSRWASRHELPVPVQVCLSLSKW